MHCNQTKHDRKKWSYLCISWI